MPELGTEPQPKKKDKQLVQLDSVRALLHKPSMQEQLRMALPNSMEPERFARLVITAVQRSPKLLGCTRQSLLGSVIECAQLGLEPGTMGQAWIIPYGNVATLVIGYRGLLQLVYRSQQIKAVRVREVYEGDSFSYDFADDKISHQPCGEKDPMKITHAWAMFETTLGGRLWDVMDRHDIDAIRKQSRAGNSGPWVTHYAEMCKKSVIRRLAKISPASVHMQRAVDLDEQADLGIDQGLAEHASFVVEEEDVETVSNDEPITVTPSEVESGDKKPEDKKPEPTGDWRDYAALADEGRKKALGMTDAEFAKLKKVYEGDDQGLYLEINRQVALQEGKK